MEGGNSCGVNVGQLTGRCMPEVMHKSCCLCENRGWEQVVNHEKVLNLKKSGELWGIVEENH